MTNSPFLIPPPQSLRRPETVLDAASAGRGSTTHAQRAEKVGAGAVIPWLALIGILATAGPSLGQGGLYVKKDSLPETMLATRASLQQWWTAQNEARSAVKVEYWCISALDGGEKIDGAAVTRLGPQLDPAGKQGGPAWTKCAANASKNAVFGNPAPEYLLGVITAQEPVALTITLSRHEGFGSWGYRPPPDGAGVRPSDALLWLNGRQVALENRLAGYERVPVAKRRGWHDAILADVRLQRGENRLLLTSCKRSQRAWFDAMRLDENPVPVLWAMIENDFPRSRYRLLDYVNWAWFDAGEGWFARCKEPFWEEKTLARLLEELGPDGQSIARRRDELRRAQVAASDGRWLNLCVTAAELHAGLRDLLALQAAVEELHTAYPESYPGRQIQTRADDLRRRLLDAAADHLDPGQEPARQLLGAIAGLKREALVDENPLLKGKKLLLVKRYTYDSNHFYDEHVSGIRRFGGGLYLLSLPGGGVTEIAPKLHSGVVGRYDLSFDARRILFNYKPCKPEGFRIYEMGVDGSGLRQVTVPPADEDQRRAAYCDVSAEELRKDPCRYGHWTDDLHPCYLPDGRIVFTSTRSEHGVLCTGHDITATNLHRINADGTGLCRLSQGALSEFCPTVMNDGRILYNRWEYVDKGAGAVQWLWAMYPDGSRSEEIGGSATSIPPVFNQAQQVPGRNNLIVCLGAGHSPFNVGAILLLDLHRKKRSEEAMTVLTPGSLPKGNWGLRQMRNGRWTIDVYGPWYADPFPLTDRTAPSAAGKFFLVSANLDKLWNEPAAYGIYLLDVFGNRVPVYADGEISCWQARPLEPRPTPPVVTGSSSVADSPETPSPDASVVVADVYRGLDGVAPGAVKYLRVMEQVPRPWSVWHGYHSNDGAPGMMVAVSLYAHLGVKVLRGVVPVREDGSAHFTVPANRNLYFQALDKDFMEIQRMRTFVNLQPGERRSCIGCHENRSRVPVNRRPLAVDYPPDRLQPQPGEVAPRPLHYPSDVQPILDRHCVACHNEKKPGGNLDLSGTMTELFCRSYEAMIHKDLVGYIQEFVGPKPEGADAMGYAAAVPPYTYGSHKSRLIAVVRGKHYDVKLSREDLIKLATWVDANAPYYGSYFGPRNIAYRDRPDFRLVPTLESALGIPPAAPQGADDGPQRAP